MTARIPTLKTERLIIRELTMDDLETVHRLLNETAPSDTPREMRERWLQWTVLGYEMFAMLKQPHYGERAITLRRTGELIGAVGIVPYIGSFGHIAAFHSSPDSPTAAEVGLYWAVASAHQHQGYATEAARSLIDYLFTRLKLGRIIATTGYNNLASQAVMRKLGMAVEQVDRSEPHNIEVVGVLYNRPGSQS